MALINRTAEQVLQASLAESTWVTYERAIDRFIRFRSQHTLVNMWPVSVGHIAAFIAYLMIQGLAASSVCTYISAISFVHKLNNWEDPTSRFIITKMKEGCKRLKSSQDSRLPITFQILKQLMGILPSVCRSNYMVRLYRAAFSSAFFGFLRVSEFTCPRGKVDITGALCFGDISIVPGGGFLSLQLRRSKTDQTGHSSFIQIARYADEEVCPVRAMANYLEVRPPLGGLLFRFYGGDPLTAQTFNKVVKDAIRALGLPSSRFSSHSFRIGAATSAAICGIPEDQIKVMGRWRSAAYRSYIRPKHLISFM